MKPGVCHAASSLERPEDHLSMFVLLNMFNNVIFQTIKQTNDLAF